eukprot:CAMPEP_0194386364 /NCGR_PEP_ID=MMETSP0174-20130528/85866_1 /TAXON_ID=216777 /ORGANISM="Proboscia alata, Strain PI-D3" /LENGTH=228 /DNA_ID=CAMNT_0039175449 /DNA_START=22 /DNA_END=708 /DNA_ORIENTATION=+
MKGLNNFLLSLSNYHPIVIEGMGQYDPRAPLEVAKQVHSQLLRHFETADIIEKPKLIITQGDPLSKHGISAITPLVADLLGVQRGLVCLDPSINQQHSRDADRTNVILEVSFSQMSSILETSISNGTTLKLEQEIDHLIVDKNKQRQLMEKAPLKDYFRDFALLQEVTKAACRQICGDVTVVHTAQDISPFSVTSFYTAGLKLGLVDEHQMVSYGVIDELDFEKIDTR